MSKSQQKKGKTMNRLKKTSAKTKIIALVMILLCIGGVYLLIQNAIGTGKAMAKEEQNKQSTTAELAHKAAAVSGADTSSNETGLSKSETVYVKTDATGSAKNITVSDWIKNVGSRKQISDKSTLTEIENIKGDEKFSQDKDGNIVWEGAGKDIWYQGKTTKALPVGVQITYKLDGKNMSAAEMKGKSGHMVMTINYTNHATSDGNTVPFTAATAMDMNSEHFKNVNVDHGAVIADGENNIVIALGFPGLSDALGLSENNLDIDIPESATIEADVTDFRMGATITSLSTKVLNKAGLDKIKSFDDLDSAITQLTSASDQLVAGSLAARQGADQLAVGTTQLANGTGTLQSGTEQYVAGVSKAADGAATLNAAVSKMSPMFGQFKTFGDGLKNYTGGVQNAYNGAKEIDTGLNQLKGNDGSDGNPKTGMNALSDGTQSLDSGLNDPATGAATGAKQIAAGTGKAANGINNMDESINGKIAAIRSALSDYGITNLDEAEAKMAELQTDINAKLASGTAEDIAIAKEEYASYSKIAAYVGNWQVLESMRQTLETPDESGASMLEQMQSLSNGAANLSAGVDKLGVGAAQLNTGINGPQGAKPAVDSLAAGADKLVGKDSQSGMNALVAGNGKINEGANKIIASMGKMDQLANGTASLNSGLNTLKANGSTLTNGVGTLNTGAVQLNAGAGQLASGLGTLSSGMNTFKSEGIDKIADAYNNNFKGFSDKLNAVKDASAAYNNFAGKADAMDGDVSFVIETDEIK